jgi:hypothetical protein
MSIETRAKREDRADPRDSHRSSLGDVRPTGVATQSSDWGESDDDEAVSLVLKISPEMDDAIDRMADDLSVSRADVLVQAMALFQMTLNAKKEGKRICITDDDLNVETEITGFGPFDDETKLASSLEQ